MHDDDGVCVCVRLLLQFRKPSFPYSFYDMWVTRDVDGQRWVHVWPSASTNTSRATLREGYPVPAYCCWNGLAALNAAPFRWVHTVD